MPTLTGKLGAWELPHVHMWKDREAEIRAAARPLISAKARIATIGSCFAEEIASAMDRLGLQGAMHPCGLFYTTRSIRQELERIFGMSSELDQEPCWKLTGGYVHPFKNYARAFPSEPELRAWSDDLDRRSEALFRSADVIVITLGLIEAWASPLTGAFYRQIPHPEVFANLQPRFLRLTVAEMLDDLEHIRSAIRRATGAQIILTVSPVPLHATLTAADVRVANTESKSRIRAAVSEFVERYPDVHYFHSFEIVTTAERLSDFMLEDGRHVRREAVDYILQQFLATFAADDVPLPQVSTSWISPPAKKAARVERKGGAWRRRIGAGVRRLLGVARAGGES